MKSTLLRSCNNETSSTPIISAQQIIARFYTKIASRASSQVTLQMLALQELAIGNGANFVLIFGFEKRVQLARKQVEANLDVIF